MQIIILVEGGNGSQLMLCRDLGFISIQIRFILTRTLRRNQNLFGIANVRVDEWLPFNVTKCSNRGC